MNARCPHCDHELGIGRSGARVGAALGAISGATASGRFGGALIGGLVGYCLGQLLEDGAFAHCPACDVTLEGSGKTTIEPTEA